MFNNKVINKLVGDVREIKEEQKDISDKLFKKKDIGDVFFYYDWGLGTQVSSEHEKPKTVSLEERIELLEKFLKVEFINTTETKKEYRYIDKDSSQATKRGRPPIKQTITEKRAKKAEYMRKWYRKNKAK